MKRSAAALLAFSMLAAPVLAGSGFIRSVEAARKDAQKNNQLIFVDFFADWCGWCHRFDREVVPSEKFQNATRDKVLLRVDTEDGKEGTELARDFGVSSLPTFLLLTPDMLIAGAIRGYAPASPFVDELIRIEKEYREFNKRVADEGTIVRNHEKRLELAKEFYRRHGFAQAETRLQKLLTERSLSDSLRDQAYYFLALTQVEQNRHEQATATLKKFFMLQNKGNSVEQGRYLLGQIYIDQKNYQAALDEFRRFKTMYPSSPLVESIDFIIPQLESAIARAQ